MTSFHRVTLCPHFSSTHQTHRIAQQKERKRQRIGGQFLLQSCQRSRMTMIESKVQIFPPTHALLTDSTKFVILPSVSRPSPSPTSSQASSFSSQSSLSSADIDIDMHSGSGSDSNSGSQGSVRMIPGTKMKDAVRNKEVAIMRLGRNRMDTLTRYNFPDVGIPFKEMADAGFFSRSERPADQPDQVECIFCQVKMSNWSAGMDPIEQHMKFNPSCEFMMGYNVNNVPVDGRTSSDPIRGCNRSRHREPDICGSGSSSASVSPTPTQQPESEAASQAQAALAPIQMKHQTPAFPRFVTYDSRLRSFPSNWSTMCLVSAEKLAEAGFFYQGPVHNDQLGPVRDAVTCYHCTREVFNWAADDDPWSEHQRLVQMANMDCYFLRLNFPRSESSTGSSSGNNSGKNSEVSTRPTSTASSSVSSSSPSPTTETEPQASASTTKPSFAEMGRTLGTLASSYEKKEPVPSDNMCIVCYGERREFLFLPCAHVMVCGSCAASLDRCPYCRAAIRSTVRVYL